MKLVHKTDAVMVRTKECLSDVSLVGAMDDTTERMMGCLLALSLV